MNPEIFAVLVMIVIMAIHLGHKSPGWTVAILVTASLSYIILGFGMAYAILVMSFLRFLSRR